MSKRKVQGVEVEIGSGNVYADLGYGEADEKLIKAQLIAKIAEIIKRKALHKPNPWHGSVPRSASE